MMRFFLLIIISQMLVSCMGNEVSTIVYYAEGKSPYDFERRIASPYYIDNDKLDVLTHALEVAGNGEIDGMLKAHSDVSGMISVSGDSIEQVSFYVFVLKYTADGVDSEVRSVAFYFDASERLIRLRCPNELLSACPDNIINHTDLWLIGYGY